MLAVPGGWEWGAVSCRLKWDAAPGSKVSYALLALGIATRWGSSALRKQIHGDWCEGARFVLLP